MEISFTMFTINTIMSYAKTLLRQSSRVKHLHAIHISCIMHIVVVLTLMHCFLIKFIAHFTTALITARPFNNDMHVKSFGEFSAISWILI